MPVQANVVPCWVLSYLFVVLDLLGREILSGCGAGNVNLELQRPYCRHVRGFHRGTELYLAC